jgi:hypothetical protein
MSWKPLSPRRRKRKTKGNRHELRFDRSLACLVCSLQCDRPFDRLLGFDPNPTIEDGTGRSVRVLEKGVVLQPTLA